MSDSEATAAQPKPINLGLSIVMAVMVAGLVLVAWVLPAEYNLDPLGTGKWLGLTGLASSSKGSTFEQSGATHRAQEQGFTSDEIHYELTPFASVEYKYHMAEGQTLVYQWRANGDLVFDLHSEEEGSNPEDAISFSTGRNSRGSGSYTAPYTGIHGWFWENRGPETVNFSLNTAGFIDSAILYEGGFANPRALDPILSVP